MQSPCGSLAVHLPMCSVDGWRWRSGWRQANVVAKLMAVVRVKVPSMR